MSLPNIEEVLKRVQELEQKLQQQEKTSVPSAPSSTVQSSATRSERNVRRKPSATAVELLNELCNALGGKLYVPPRFPDRPLCLIDHVFGVSVEYDPKRNADVVRIEKIRGVEYRQVGKVRRRELVLDVATMDIVPQRSIRFEVALESTTKNPRYPSFNLELGNWYSTLSISRKIRTIGPERAVSLACTAADSRGEHRIACVMLPSPEVSTKFEFNEKTRQWAMVKGRRRFYVFRGL
ncbi:MAG: hypothetical protein GXO26_07980 [Crenarchaeota archaeon]|nr:hypothetical protein [Thermoproteota archaeon]